MFVRGYAVLCLMLYLNVMHFFLFFCIMSTHLQVGKKLMYIVRQLNNMLIDIKWREKKRTKAIASVCYLLVNLHHAIKIMQCAVMANAINQMPTVKCSRKSNKSHWEMKSPLQQNDEYIYKIISIYI